MGIERFDLFRGGDCHCELADTAFGKYILFTDAEADKAEAVAEAVAKETAELRAELVTAWAAGFAVAGYQAGILRILADHTFNGVPTVNIAARMVAVGCWERLDDDGDHQCYRPVESRSSGGSDD